MDENKFESISIKEEDIQSAGVTILLDELSHNLQVITGDSGQNSFNLSDIDNPRAVFVVARDNEGELLGCGCIRPISDEVAELKRMYARYKSRGIGRQIVSYLEACAKELEYKTIWLETRAINQKAIGFYEANGYYRIENYGKYVGNNKAVCFEKKMEMG